MNATHNKWEYERKLELAFGTRKGSNRKKWFAKNNKKNQPGMHVFMSSRHKDLATNRKRNVHKQPVMQKQLPGKVMEPMQKLICIINPRLIQAQRKIFLLGGRRYRGAKRTMPLMEVVRETYRSTRKFFESMGADVVKAGFTYTTKNSFRSAQKTLQLLSKTERNRLEKEEYVLRFT